MKKTLVFCALLLLAATAFATPANVGILDGRPIEYDATDLRSTFQGPSSWGANGTLSNLFVTWDATYLYIGLQAWQAGNNKLVVLLDVDPGAGTGATTTTNWTSVEPSFIKYNDYGWVAGGTFGLDYLFASEGTFNNVIRINYNGVDVPTTNNLDSLFDLGNGANPAITPVDMASLNDATACPHKGFETRIAWARLYAGTRFGTVEAGETVPRGATLRLLAGIHNNDPNIAWSSPDTLPNQAVTNHVNGILTTADYLDVLIDSNSNGVPDVLGGDNNAPWIRAASGAVGGTNLLVAFSEAVTAASAETPANWSVGGSAPSSASALSPNLVRLGLAAPIASTNLLLIVADGVEDTAANTRPVEHCLFPAASGIPLPVTVTFQVNTNSGMGVSAAHARPSAFFVNGAALPLEWGYSGYPPHESTQMTPIPGSNGWVSATVNFLAGTPSELFYKYSARVSGSNNYEAIRLDKYADISRQLTLNTNGSPMTVIEYLGAAAYPLRNTSDTNTPSALNRLYTDAQRGDAGVRVRREILFQLDLTLRDRSNLQRVMVLGSDPLRGFNSNGEDANTATDYPGPYVTWATAGIELNDTGANGDVTAGDGIYSRLWAFSTNGVDATMEPELPNSLVGGSDFTEPYVGTWQDRRSPRSFIYKFYVLTSGGTSLDSPNWNLEYYIADPNATAQITLPPFIWDDDAIPPPPPSNAPALTGISLTGSTAYVRFENVTTEGSHGVKIATNLLSGFQDYGHRGTAGGTNAGQRQWSASIAQASSPKEFYAAYAGPERDPLPYYWEPSFVPAAANTWRVHFSQYKTNLKGKRTMFIAGPFTGWGTAPLPMTFLGDGHWMVDVPLAAGSETVLEYKFLDGSTWLDGDNRKAIRGGAGATWTPDQPTPDQLFAVTFDAAGTPLAAATNINIHMGFDPFWSETASRPMTNTAGSVWEYALVVPTNYSISVNWVFNGYIAGSQTWYSPADWKAWMTPLVGP